MRIELTSVEASAVSDSTHDSRAEQGHPPHNGQQDHEAMRAASMWPIDGPASTDTLAASGGLTVPGNDPRAPMPLAADTSPREPIPGERDPTNTTHRPPGAMGTLFNADL